MQGQNPHTGQNFSLLQNIHTGFIIHPNLYSLGTGVLFLGLNRSGREVYPSRPSNARPPLYVFWQRKLTRTNLIDIEFHL
jgi:hypothetical protein